MRADQYLVKYGHAPSRTLAQKLIAAGAVVLDGQHLSKPAEDIDEATEHSVVVGETAHTRYVGRGGLKLEAALAAFPISPAGATVADIGASTGGFTDCLLQNSAARVFAIDSGHGQLHPRLLEDPRVRCGEGINARTLLPAHLCELETRWQESHAGDGSPAFDGLVDGCVMDVSFISQTLLHASVAGLLRPGGWFIALIKPQFELTKGQLDKHGIVKNEAYRERAVERVKESAAANGLVLRGLIPSPIEGGDGNREYLAWLEKSRN